MATAEAGQGVTATALAAPEATAEAAALADLGAILAGLLTTLEAARRLDPGLERRQTATAGLGQRRADCLRLSARR